ncbi:MAG: hypothetical protein M1820_010256 [Bogoriella megaspora]|nr:MAG: hypothetical protein M1820_010256 [Bogoriella megaspora]
MSAQEGPICQNCLRLGRECKYQDSAFDVFVNINHQTIQSSKRKLLDDAKKERSSSHQANTSKPRQKPHRSGRLECNQNASNSLSQNLSRPHEPWQSLMPLSREVPRQYLEQHCHALWRDFDVNYTHTNDVWSVGVPTLQFGCKFFDLAAMALSLHRLAISKNSHTYGNLSLDAYAIAVQGQRRMLSVDQPKVPIPLLAVSALLLALFEGSQTSSLIFAHRFGFQSHTHGAFVLMQRAGPAPFREPGFHEIFKKAREMAVHTSVALEQRTFMGEKDWMTVPWQKQSKTWRDCLHDIAFDVAEIVNKVKSACKGEEVIHKDALSDQLLEKEEQLISLYRDWLSEQYPGIVIPCLRGCRTHCLCTIPVRDFPSAAFTYLQAEFWAFALAFYMARERLRTLLSQDVSRCLNEQYLASDLEIALATPCFGQAIAGGQPGITEGRSRSLFCLWALDKYRASDLFSLDDWYKKLGGRLNGLHKKCSNDYWLYVGGSFQDDLFWLWDSGRNVQFAQSLIISHADLDKERMDSSRIRSKGNEIYKRGGVDNFLCALRFYKRAAEIDGSDWKSQKNISTVNYELGKYHEALEHGLKALRIKKKMGDSDEELLLRIVKCCVLLKEYDKATLAATVSGFTCPEGKTLSEIVPSGEGDLAKGTLHDYMLLPRYLPSVVPAHEYYPVDLDYLHPLWNIDLLGNPWRPQPLSVLLGGVGDARHLYFTIMEISMHVCATTGLFPKVHFTTVDIRPEMMARNLIMLIALDKLAHPETDAARRGALTTLVFFYLCPLMPPYVYQAMQAHIDAAINHLECKSCLPDWIVIEPNQYQPIKDVLKVWSCSEVSPAVMLSRTCEMERNMGGDRTEQAILQEKMSRLNVTPAERRDLDEEELFWKTGYIHPAEGFIDLEPELATLLRQDQSSERDLAIHQYVLEHWKSNISMADEFGIQDEEWNPPYSPYRFANILSYSVGASVPRQHYQAGTLVERLEHFFTETAKGIRLLKDRLKIELIVGEISSVLEEMRNGIPNQRLQYRDPEFPLAYDIIYLNNVPDFLGGNLMTILYAVPLLKSKPKATVQTNSLRYAFEGMSEFNSEYLCVTDTRSAFGVHGELAVDDFLSPWPNPMATYCFWTPTESSQTIPSRQLLPRHNLERWLHQLFLKIILPAIDPPFHVTATIFRPLNITVLFRLLSYLQEHGYPAHWLSSVMDTLLSNTLYTRARAPRTCPLAPSELVQAQSSKTRSIKFDLSPFQPEIRTLMAMARQRLSFGVISKYALQPVHVGKYRASMKLGDVSKLGYNTWVAVFKDACSVLVFWNQILLRNETELSFSDVPLYDLLRCEKDADIGECWIRLRRSGLIVVSTWIWDEKQEQASFWIDKDIVNKQWRDKDNEWWMQIWERESYTPVSLPFRITDANQDEFCEIKASQ